MSPELPLATVNPKVQGSRVTNSTYPDRRVIDWISTVVRRSDSRIKVHAGIANVDSTGKPYANSYMNTGYSRSSQR